MSWFVVVSRLEVWSAEGGQLEAALAHKAQRFHTLLQRFISVMHIGTDVRTHTTHAIDSYKLGRDQRGGGVAHASPDITLH